MKGATSDSQPRVVDEAVLWKLVGALSSPAVVNVALVGHVIKVARRLLLLPAQQWIRVYENCR